jgi:hypothetical protein
MVGTWAANKQGRPIDMAMASRYIDIMAMQEDSWGRWQELIHADDPDPLAILRLGAQFQAYFSTVEREALQAARGDGMTWAQLGEALGTSRQAVWQRATTWDAGRRTGRPASGRYSDEETHATLQRAREDWAVRTDRAAAAMFDGPPFTRR